MNSPANSANKGHGPLAVLHTRILGFKDEDIGAHVLRSRLASEAGPPGGALSPGEGMVFSGHRGVQRDQAPPCMHLSAEGAEVEALHVAMCTSGIRTDLLASASKDGRGSPAAQSRSVPAPGLLCIHKVKTFRQAVYSWRIARSFITAPLLCGTTRKPRKIWRSDERRDAAIGFSSTGRSLTVVHIEVHDDSIRRISARRASATEETIYAQ